ncbi:hypothetical protein SKAU_G00049740 [Synaphobranchus kaupii]|uniref:Uncharacterized protein n=1 Tax=Synaphobranchus kaupii TaxID=118154 RepID=A0A9Q1G3T5_SYNKA|nr:hypothetical protein SKAU_G00049740 [Synaphobranchus kaupii]
MTLCFLWGSLAQSVERQTISVVPLHAPAPPARPVSESSLPPYRPHTSVSPQGSAPATELKPPPSQYRTPLHRRVGAIASDQTANRQPEITVGWKEERKRKEGKNGKDVSRSSDAGSASRRDSPTFADGDEEEEEEQQL